MKNNSFLPQRTAICLGKPFVSSHNYIHNVPALSISFLCRRVRVKLNWGTTVHSLQFEPVDRDLDPCLDFCLTGRTVYTRQPLLNVTHVNLFLVSAIL